MDPYIGQILLVPYNFAPSGWHFCDGTLLPINQYNALYALLGTVYGGDGKTTFGLPDLRGRVPLGSGQNAPTNANYVLGTKGGEETVTLLTSQMPAHTHILQASNGASTSSPTGAYPGTDGLQTLFDAAANTTFNVQMASAAGGSQPHDNRQPYQVLNYIIALEGIYPTRG